VVTDARMAGRQDFDMAGRLKRFKRADLGMAGGTKNLGRQRLTFRAQPWRSAFMVTV
jgi:hypothetical protein